MIKKRVALLDATALGLGVTVFTSIRTSQHDLEWLEKFVVAVANFPEVLDVYRISGDVDYLLRVVVPSIDHYDRFYKRLIAAVALNDVSSSFVVEQIKHTTALPLDVS